MNGGKARTIESALQGDNAFDLLRLLAALGVVVSHAWTLTHGDMRGEWLMRLSGGQVNLGEVGVAAFFVISGFLIAQSFERAPSWIDYMVFRLLRIVPGLVVVCVLVALLLGPLLTTLPLEKYFSERATWRYLAGGAVYNIAQHLPGVFESNPYARVVNGSLWTLAYEFTCYTALAGIGLLWRRDWLAAAALLAFTVYGIFGTWCAPGLFLSVGPFFALGALAYLARRHIRLDARLAALCAACIAATVVLQRGASLALLLAGPYLVLWLAFRLHAVRLRWLQGRDLSYGVYIYAFPIQQALVPWAATPLNNLLASLPLILVCATLSWQWVERPALAKKRQMAAALRRRLGLAR